MMIVAAIVSIVLIGRIFDHVLAGYHLPAIICAVSLLAALSMGGFSALKNRVGIPLIGLIVWMFLCTPFSSWKGGSALDIMYFSFYALMWLPMALGPRNVKDLNRLILLLAMINLVTLSLTKIDDGGRLQGVSGSYSNSGDMALIALYSVPLWLVIAFQIRVPALRILAACSSSLFLVVSAAKTGTRAAIIAGAGMAAVYFLRSTVTKKIILALALLAAIPSIYFFVPYKILERLSTVTDAVGSDAMSGQGGEAQGSAAMRRELLLDSIRITLQHPLFGVGPGQFASFRWTEGKHRGVKLRWFVTHNAYTQISSEEGIPGLIFFVAILVGINRTIRISRKLNTPDSHRDWIACRTISTGLHMSLVCMVLFGFFLPNAYYIFWYLLGGLALALERVTLQGIRQAQNSAALAPTQFAPALIFNRR